MGETRKAHQAFLDLRQLEPERDASGDRAGGVLRIVHAAQRADAGELRRRMRFAGGSMHDPAALRVIAVAHRRHQRNAHHRLAGALDAVGGRAGVAVVDADHRGAALLHACRQQRLDRGIVLHVAVAIEVVFRHVQQDTDRGFQRRRQIDLIGRNLQHIAARVFAILRERLQRQYRHADIAAHLRVAAGASEQMRGQRRGGRFTVGAGDGDQRATGAGLRALAAEQFDVADDLDARLARQRRRPVRCRMRQRHAGRQHQGGDL